MVRMGFQKAVDTCHMTDHVRKLKHRVNLRPIEEPSCFAQLGCGTHRNGAGCLHGLRLSRRANMRSRLCSPHSKKARCEPADSSSPQHFQLFTIVVVVDLQFRLVDNLRMGAWRNSTCSLSTRTISLYSTSVKNTLLAMLCYDCLSSPACLDVKASELLLGNRPQA